MDTVDDVIAELGGPTAVARIIGKTPQAVTNMRARGSIPSEYWAAIVRAATKGGLRGITYEALARIAAGKRATARPARPTRARRSTSAHIG